MSIISDSAAARVEHLPAAIQSHGPRVVFDPRVSGGGQLGRGSQSRQLAAGSQAIRDAGGKLVGVVDRGIARPGRLTTGRPDLVQGFERAARWRAMLVFFNVGRMLRADDSHGQRAPFVLPTAEEIDTVLRLAERWGVIVATIDPPDLDGRESRSRDTKRGMALGGPPGRPQAIDTLPRRTVQTIIGLRAAGESRRGITRVVGLPESTVRAVISRAEKEGNFVHHSL